MSTIDDLLKKVEKEETPITEDVNNIYNTNSKEEEPTMNTFTNMSFDESPIMEEKSYEETPTKVELDEIEELTYQKAGESNTRFCNNCGMMITDDTSICPSCGEPLD